MDEGFRRHVVAWRWLRQARQSATPVPRFRDEHLSSIRPNAADFTHRRVTLLVTIPGSIGQRRFPNGSVVVLQSEVRPLHCELTMPTNTVRLHRVIRATPDRVYRAFLD
ncbi:MAG TPA: hypothetical protein VJ608_07445, partial [Albitalea sp.]|nr:hypothetical protein [Albitalea sp.]